MFKKITNRAILEVMKDFSEEKIYDTYIRLIYLCCEGLQNPDLHRECGVKDPYDIVNCIFSIKEILSIGNELSEFLEITDAKEKEEEDVKN